MPLVTKPLIDLFLILGIITSPIFVDLFPVVFTVLSSLISDMLLVLAGILFCIFSAIAAYFVRIFCNTCRFSAYFLQHLQIFRKSCIFSEIAAYFLHIFGIFSAIAAYFLQHLQIFCNSYIFSAYFLQLLKKICSYCRKYAENTQLVFMQYLCAR